MRPLAILLLLAMPCAATDLESLVAEDKLRLRSWLEPETNIVVGQEVKLVLEIATPRWFAGGTRVSAPEIPGVVVLQRDVFATNLSRREGGDTWVLQQWRLEMYPQREGRVQVPQVSIELAVNDADAGIVRGSLSSRALSFDATVPAVLEGVPSWLATPEFSVQSTLDRPPEGLVPGDAFTRTIELRATATAAMMLPEISLEPIPGLAAYPDLPELENRSNRGQATAIRRQSITYLVEQPGRYRLPAQTLYWWNTERGRAERATLEAVEIDAGTAVPGGPGKERTWPPWLPWVVVGALIIGAGVLALTRWQRRHHSYDASEARREIRSALRNGDAAAAARHLYAWLNTRAGQPGWLSLRDTMATEREPSAGEPAEELLASVYASREWKGDSAAALYDAVLRAERKPSVRRVRRTANAPQLNPGQPRK